MKSFLHNFYNNSNNNKNNNNNNYTYKVQISTKCSSALNTDYEL